MFLYLLIVHFKTVASPISLVGIKTLIYPNYIKKRTELRWIL